MFWKFQNSSESASTIRRRSWHVSNYIIILFYYVYQHHIYRKLLSSKRYRMNLPMTANHSHKSITSFHPPEKKYNRRNNDINAAIIHFIFWYNCNSVTMELREHKTINPFFLRSRFFPIEYNKRSRFLCSFSSLRCKGNENFSTSEIILQQKQFYIVAADDNSTLSVSNDKCSRNFSSYFLNLINRDFKKISNCYVSVKLCENLQLARNIVASLSFLIEKEFLWRLKY